jgi:hypothetical protein
MASVVALPGDTFEFSSAIKKGERRGTKMRKFSRLALILLLSVPGVAQMQVQPTFFGMHVNKMKSFPLKVPAGSIRLWDTGTNWAQICETRNSCDWKRFDNWLESAKRNGITDVVYTFGKVPDWIASYPPDKPQAAKWGTFPPRDITPDGGGSDEAWKGFVKAIVDHTQHLDSSHAKVTYWGIWNEPSAGNFWKGTPEQLVRMAKDAYAIIKAAQPNALVLSPELSAIGRLHDDWFDNYVTAGGGAYMDVVAFHGYATARQGAGDLMDSPDHPHPVPEDVIKAVAHVREKVARHPELRGKPLWDSEGSWAKTNENNWGPEADDEQQAYVVRYYALQASLGIERVYWYMYDPNGEGGCCGAMIHVDGRETAAAAGYREAHKWLLGRTVSGCAPKGHVWTCNLEGSGYKGTMVWTDEYGKTASYDATGFASYREIGGGSSAVQKSHTVTIANKPILLETK